MKPSAHIYNELKEASPFLAEMERMNVFSVPENYFERLTSQIVQRTANPFFTLPASEPHFSPVPEGYFDSLATNVLRKIKSLERKEAPEELKELSPMLYAVQGKNVFSVPDGYFENLPDAILKKTQTPAKVVTMKTRSIWKYASAAMLTGIIAVSALWITTRPLQQTAVINNSETIPSYVKEAIQYKNAAQINAGIANLDDDDIISYLEITGNNSDDDLLATSVPETDLPAEKDYLLNDKTLDMYLSEIDVKPNQN